MTTLNYYRVYCIEENTHAFVWGETAPTLCPNDHSDRSINSSLTTIIKSISSSNVVATDSTPDSAYFQVTCKKFTVPDTLGNNQSHDFDISFPFDVYVWNMTFYFSNNSTDDTIDFIVNPDYLIGTTTEASVIGSNTITVSDSVIQEIAKGSELTIVDGGNSHVTGYITNIDTSTKTIIITNNFTSVYPSGSTVKLSRYTIRNYNICSNETEMGHKGLKTMLIPANVVSRLRFTNTSQTQVEKTVHIKMEYYMK